jgi:hypothetical protein
MKAATVKINEHGWILIDYIHKNKLELDLAVS